MTINWQWRCVIAFFKNRLGAFYVMEVRIDDCSNGRRRELAQAPQCFTHLLNRLSGVNCNDSFRRFDERLI